MFEQGISNLICATSVPCSVRVRVGPCMDLDSIDSHLLSELGKRLSRTFLNTLYVGARRPTLEPHARCVRKPRWGCHKRISWTYLRLYRFPNPNSSMTSSTIIIHGQGGAIVVPIRTGVVRSKWRELQRADYRGPPSGIHEYIRS